MGHVAKILPTALNVLVPPALGVTLVNSMLMNVQVPHAKTEEFVLMESTATVVSVLVVMRAILARKISTIVPPILAKTEALATMVSTNILAIAHPVSPAQTVKSKTIAFLIRVASTEPVLSVVVQCANAMKDLQERPAT